MDKGFKILERLLSLTGLRQGVLASNIANADTPGYRRRDVKFETELANELPMKTTNTSHISTGNSTSVPVLLTEEGDEWLDKNNIDLDIEMAKMTENALLYQAGIKMLSTKIRMFRNALRR